MKNLVLRLQNAHVNCMGHLLSEREIDPEYDRAKVPPYNGNDPRPPLVV